MIYLSSISYTTLSSKGNCHRHAAAQLLTFDVTVLRRVSGGNENMKETLENRRELKYLQDAVQELKDVMMNKQKVYRIIRPEEEHYLRKPQK